MRRRRGDVALGGQRTRTASGLQHAVSIESRVGGNTDERGQSKADSKPEFGRQSS